MDLEKLIAERLEAAMELSRAAGLELPDGAGCGLGEAIPGGAVIRLSLGDVARIAAVAAKSWF